MKASDICIGDWFRAVDFNSPFRVTAIYDDLVQTQADYQSEIDGNWYSEAYIKDLVPIELTEDILVKNGFEFKRHEFKTTNDEYWISDDKRIIFRGEHMTNSFNKWSVHVDTEDMRTMAYLEITYIHQLQHLLRLCNAQKEIEL